ncbi:MAG: F0F1 ATP synthase subunit B' [Rhodobiaceae bacterium]|nr:F0F1 ATP synthase subunit B' [Rhodobiaceae bacterium]
MPQLDPAFFAPQLVWLFISFIALYFLLGSFALPKIGGVIKARQDRLDDDLSQAETFRQEAEQAMADYETALAEARSKAAEIIQEVRDATAAELAKKEAELEEKLSAQAAEAEGRIQASRVAALTGIQETAEAVVAEIVQITIGQEVKEDAVKKAVSEEMNNRR